MVTHCSMTLEIYEYVSGQYGKTGEFSFEPFEYKYIGNFNRVEEILEHYKQEGFEKFDVGGRKTNDDGNIVNVESKAEPLPGQKRIIVEGKIAYASEELPEDQKVEVK